MQEHNPSTMYGTTIVTVRKGGKVVIAGDGQVSLGNTVMKGNARKVRLSFNATLHIHASAIIESGLQDLKERVHHFVFPGGGSGSG